MSLVCVQLTRSAVTCVNTVSLVFFRLRKRRACVWDVPSRGDSARRRGSLRARGPCCDVFSFVPFFLEFQLLFLLEFKVCFFCFCFLGFLVFVFTLKTLLDSCQVSRARRFCVFVPLAAASGPLARA